MKTLADRWQVWLAEFIADPEDSESERIRKVVTFSGFIAALILNLPGALLMAWGGWVPGWVLITAGLFSLLVIGSMLLRVRFSVTVNLGLLLGLVVPFMVHIGLGGYPIGMAAALWGFLSVIGALILLGRRAAVGWLVVFGIAIGLAAVVDPGLFPQPARQIPPAYHPAFFAVSVFLLLGLLFGVLYYLIQQLDEARERADTLLLNILPGPIAAQLKANPGTIANGHHEVTVLFADIVDFTRLSADADPVAVVEFLNQIFSAFDDLAARHGLEKIKTIGDAYMVAAGLPEPRADHCEAVAAFAFDILEVVQGFRTWQGQPVHLRVGINTGSVVAGVIGRQKFIYDLWGDAVNTASRMESNGVVDVIQVTEAVREALGNRYTFEARPPIQIKGKGEMVTYLLKRRPA